MLINKPKYKTNDIVITTTNHIIKIINVDTEWNKKTNNDSTYYTYKIIKKSDSFYVGERISDSNIIGYYKEIKEERKMIGRIKEQTELVKINNKLNFYCNIVTFEGKASMRDVVLYDSNKKVFDSWMVEEDLFEEGFYDKLINGLKNINTIEKLLNYFMVNGKIIETQEDDDEDDFFHISTFNTVNGCVYVKVYY